MARLRVYRGREHRYDYVIEKAEVIVGRSRDADVPLDSEAVSRRHLRIRREGRATFVLEDLGTKNGAFVNGKYCGFRILEHGDRIEIAQHVLVFEKTGDVERPRTGENRFRLASHQISGALHGGQERVEQQVAVVEGHKTAFMSLHSMEALRANLQVRRAAHVAFHDDAGKRIEIPLSKPRHLVGWTEDCDVRLPGRRWFARVAAVIEEQGGGHTVRALSRWRRLRVAGAKLEDFEFADDTVVEIGGVKLRYRSAMNT